MRHVVSSSGLVILALFWSPVPAMAQVITITSCARATYAVLAGPVSHGDDVYSSSTRPAGRTLDVAGSVSLPVSDFDEVRADVGSAAWTFERHERDGAFTRETLRIRRATISAVKLSRRNCSPVRLMTGYGLGVYSYRVDGSRVTKPGVHGLVGLEVEVSDRAAVTGEAALHLFGGPRRPSAASALLLGIRFGVGARFRF